MQDEQKGHESCFVVLAGLKRVYDPGCGTGPSRRKHPCPDCHFCQDCSDARCHACRSERNRHCKAQCRQKLSLRDQIALYEELNRSDGSPPGNAGASGGKP